MSVYKRSQDPFNAAHQRSVFDQSELGKTKNPRRLRVGMKKGHSEPFDFVYKVPFEPNSEK